MRNGRRRFIPAYAGNAGNRCSRSPAAPVHPRVCGERPAINAVKESVGGSSPRMRGTLPLERAERIVMRFIPAYAGNAPHPLGWHEDRPVHPRVCGERGRHAHPGRPQVGSSPRMRGTHATPNRDSSRRRFIPAYAGNAADRMVICDTYAVHPRVCGERGRHAHPGRQQGGSSPRMRGTPLRAGDQSYLTRFIPAYAGNACRRFARLLCWSVHPRVCGERVVVRLIGAIGRGSSPRMRGTQQLAKTIAGIARFIPAYAGNASRSN